MTKYTLDKSGWQLLCDGVPCMLLVVPQAAPAGTDARALREFIVKACNAHDELVAALRDLVAGADAMDARLLKLTDSPKECERGDIARARALLEKLA